MTAKKEKRFQVILSEELFGKLTALALNEGLSRGAVVRRLLHAKVRMVFLHKPQCVTGTPCFVPHMHEVMREHRGEGREDVEKVGENTNGA